MKAILPAVIAVSLCGGCTSTALQSYTLNQAMSVSDLRYRQAMHALAAVASNDGVLPSFALTAGGTANLTNTLSIDTATLWDAAVYGFSKETFIGFGQHNPELQWILDPVVSEPQIEALGHACRWAVSEALGGGPPPPGSRAWELLRKPTRADVNACPMDVKLIDQVHASHAPIPRRNVILLDKEPNRLHILVYDVNGYMFLDTDDTKLAPEAHEALNRLFNRYWPHHDTLNEYEKNKIHSQLAKILGHSLERKPTFHFDVADQLQRLAYFHRGWLHVSSKHSVPRNACYKATCGDKAVWVAKEGMGGLSEFVFVMLDIGSTDPASLVVPSPTASVAIAKGKQTGLVAPLRSYRTVQ